MLQWKNNVFLRITFVVLSIVCLATILSLQIEYNRLQNERQLLLDKISESNEKVEEIQSALNTPFDEEYIVKYAREKLNYRLPEEIVFYNDYNQ